MTRMDKLMMVASHLDSARAALLRSHDRVASGTEQGPALASAQCERTCSRCYLHCAGLTGLISDLEQDLERLGGMSINGVSYAFAGRA